MCSIDSIGGIPPCVRIGALIVVDHLTAQLRRQKSRGKHGRQRLNILICGITSAQRQRDILSGKILQNTRLDRNRAKNIVKQLTGGHVDLIDQSRNVRAALLGILSIEFIDCTVDTYIKTETEPVSADLTVFASFGVVF